MRFSRAMLLLLVACCSSSALYAQVGDDDFAARLDSLLTARLEATRCPGLSLAVAKNDRIVFSEAVGLADIEQSVPMTTTSVHRLASVSKPVTGAIILDLVDQGKLDLDVPVRRYLPELPETYSAITLRHLLDHQSGIIHEGAEMFFSMDHYATTREALKVFVNIPLRFEPGTKTEYSSPAFAVAGATAEAVTGKSFQQVAADFFAAHNIRGFYLDDIYAIVPNRVRGYSVDRTSTATFQDGSKATHDYLDGTPGEVTNARDYDISSRYPAGGFDASAEDLLQFVIAVGRGDILSDELRNEMWIGQTTSDGKKSEMGLGWGVGERDGRIVVGMNGSTPATTTSLLYFPESGDGVALFCNAEGAKGLTGLRDEVMGIAFR